MLQKCYRIAGTRNVTKLLHNGNVTELLQTPSLASFVQFAQKREPQHCSTETLKKR